MNIPSEIMDKLLEIANDFEKKELAQKFKEVSERYRGKKQGESLVNQQNEAVAYAISRMPATFGAVSSAMAQSFNILKEECQIKTMIDVGAGTGAATLAVSEQLVLENITCLEREEAMMDVGKKLLSSSEIQVVKNAKWKKIDIVKENYEEKADIVVVSYMLNELDEKTRLEVLEKLWNMTNQILLIIDPGTPTDYLNMLEMKQFLVDNGANIVAPCTRQIGCDLPKDDWCHFLCRIERTRLQKNVKEADVPYEDEKFTYLAASKQMMDKTTKSRIIRHPKIKTNLVEVKLCEDGKIVNRVYTKKEKEIYKKARKWKVGDTIEE